MANPSPPLVLDDAEYGREMDWYVHARDPDDVQELRREIVGHLATHAAPEAEVGDVGLAVGQLLGNLIKHAPGPAWVSLNWPADTVALVVTDLRPGFVPDRAGRSTRSRRAAEDC